VIPGGRRSASTCARLEQAPASEPTLVPKRKPHPRVRIEAAGELLDRGFGRAPIAAGIEVSVVADHSLMALARRLSAQDVEALRARARDYNIDGEAIEH
jgi:hypothetical protein